MILVIGGICSGRHSYIKNLSKNNLDSQIYEISKEDAILFDSEKSNFAVSRVVERISSFSFVIATEIGCGIVPISEEERFFRDCNGKLNIALAKIAKTVVLVTCGIPQIIKGELPKSFFSTFAIIFRHGQTDSNRFRRFAGGITDVPLNLKGIEQVKSTKEKFKLYFENYQIDVKEKILNPTKIFVSPMIRCQETAKILFPNSEIVTIEDLREMKMGLFENMTHDELISGKFADGSYCENNAKIYQSWLDSNGELEIPSNEDFFGESKSSFKKRIEKAFEEILISLKKNELPVIVAHGGVQMSICNKFFQKSIENLYEWQSENAMFRFGELK